ncbi:MAG: HEAT repeat domain-containing protein [Gemmatimonadaceae bacterium]
MLEAIARRGTAGDAQWLLAIARDANQPVETRRRALDLAARGGMTSTQMLALYDGVNDPTLKESLIRLYAQSGDRAAVEKLISIARTDSSYTLRRRAISSLSRTDDPRARQALVEITTLTTTR